MNTTLVKALILFTRQRPAASLSVLVGPAGFVVMVATHIAEGRWLPSMAWGQPHSAGHYLDLASAILGITLIPLGLLLRRRA
jgi:hypothetical protein